MKFSRSTQPKLKGPVKWNYFHLYVILEIFSRYVVSWMVAYRESATLAKRLIKETCSKQQVSTGQLTLHVERGSSMKSKLVAHLLADLGVTKTHNRPHVGNDNPYSESQFKTLKYSSGVHERFGSIQDAREFCRRFFLWYNTVHKHSGIGFTTPEQVHYGKAEQIQEQRAIVLESAFKDHGKRFKGKMPKPFPLPKAAWINKPDESQAILLLFLLGKPPALPGDNKSLTVPAKCRSLQARGPLKVTRRRLQ